MKKYFLISLFMFILVVILSCNCFADNYIDLEFNQDNNSMYNILSSYDIINGFPNGNFMPSNCVTRAQMAKIAIVLKGYKNYTVDLKSSFNDVGDHWARKYIELSNVLHLVEGYDDNTFRPNEYILYNDAIKVILKVLGYNDDNIVDLKNINNKSCTNGTSYNKYVSKAKEIGILDNIYNQSIYMTRGNIAKIIYNSLNCELVYKNNNNSNKNIKLFDNIGKFERIKITDAYALLHKEFDLSKYLLNTCDVYYDKNNNIVCVQNPLYNTVSLHIKKFLSTNCVLTLDRYKNIQTYKIYNVPIIFNSIKSKPSRKKLEDSEAIFLLGKNDVIVSVVVEKITKTAIIKSTDVYNGENTFVGCLLPLKKEKPDMENVIVQGAVTKLTDIKENDVVYFKETLEDNNNKSILKLQVVRNNIKGTFDGTCIENYKTHYIINNKSYEVSKDNEIKEIPSKGDTVLVIFDKDENIIDVKITKYIKKPTSFGTILSVKDESAKLPSINIIDSNGKTSTFNLKENCGCVIKSTNKNSIIYTTTLSKGDIVLYYVENNIIKIIEKQNVINIKSLYDNNNNLLKKNNLFIDKDTKILMNNNKLNKNQLGYYIEGKAITDKNKVLMINITMNLFKESEENKEGETLIIPQQTKFTGHIISAIYKVKSTSQGNKILLFNNNKYFDIKKGYSIDDYVNSLIKVSIKDDEVVDITKYNPEISKSSVTKTYNLQLQIDNTSFVEYSENTLVFSCKYDKDGKLIKFNQKKICDIKIGSNVEFYQTENNYNGVMNVILILE